MKSHFKWLRRMNFPLLLIIFFGLLLRFYKFSSPLADHHSWRQADSAAVIRNLERNNFNWAFPQWNNLMPTNAGNLPNPNRYFFEDFPLAYDIYPAILYRFFGPKIEWARLVSIIFSSLTIVFLFSLVKNLTGPAVAYLTSFFYAIFPFSVFFSRGIFQEIGVNFYALAALFSLERWLVTKKPHFFIPAIIANILLFLAKPYSLVIIIPELYLFFRRRGIRFWQEKPTVFYFLFSFLPFLLWWAWVRRFPEGIPYSGWLLNEGNIRFRGAFFWWIFLQRIAILILGGYGLIFFGAGLIAGWFKRDGLMYLWLASLMVYVLVIARGNVTHDYYQIPLLPVIFYFSAKGVIYWWEAARSAVEKLKTGILIVFFLIFSLAFSWHEVRGFYEIKSGVDLAGPFIDSNTPRQALIIAGDGADSTLLYNCNRNGWTIGFGALMENTPEVIERLRSEGADFYVTTQINQIRGTDFEKYLKSHYLLIKETDQFVVYDLSSSKA